MVAAENGEEGGPTIEVDVTPSEPQRDRPPRRGAGDGVDHDRERPQARCRCRSTRCWRWRAAAMRSRSPKAACTASRRSTLGLFDDAEGLVQVSGHGVSAGQRVVVPST